MTTKKTIFYLLIALISSTAAQAANKTTLPGKLGPYPISISRQELRTNRNDTLAPTKQLRRVMLSLYQPRFDLCDKPCPDPLYSAYMPPRTMELAQQTLVHIGAPNGTLERIQVESCPLRESHNLHDSSALHQQAPLLIFSPGSGATVFEYTSMLSAVTSSGYTIVAIDHTYDASAVEFPDGTLATQNYDDIAKSTNLADAPAILAYLGGEVVPVRVEDVRSVIDAVEQGKIKGLEAYAGRGKLKPGVWGHSLGGCTALVAAANDERVKGSINLDGIVGGLAADAKIRTPAILVSSETGLSTPIPQRNASWDATWEAMEAWKLEFYAKGTAHSSYSDYVVIADTLGLRASLPATAVDYIGTISGKRALEIVWKYTTAFFDYVIEGKHQKLLEEESKQFPEVIFLLEDEEN